MKFNTIATLSLMITSVAIGPLLGMHKQSRIPQNRIQVLAKQINPQKTVFKNVGGQLPSAFKQASPIACSTGISQHLVQKNFRSEINNLLINHQLPEDTPSTQVIFW